MTNGSCIWFVCFLEKLISGLIKCFHVWINHLPSSSTFWLSVMITSRHIHAGNAKSNQPHVLLNNSTATISATWPNYSHFCSQMLKSQGLLAIKILIAYAVILLRLSDKLLLNWLLKPQMTLETRFFKFSCHGTVSILSVVTCFCCIHEKKRLLSTNECLFATSWLADTVLQASE